MRTIVLAPRLFPLLVLSALTAPAFAATSNVGATAAGAVVLFR